MAIDLQQRRQGARKKGGWTQSLRWGTRGAMVVAIAAIAVYRGYAPAAMLWLGLVVIWAASLPFLLRTMSRAVREREVFQGALGTVIVFALAAFLLFAFAVTARRVLLGFE